MRAEEDENPRGELIPGLPVRGLITVLTELRTDTVKMMSVFNHT
jgi:hypothetical protein